MAQTFNVYSLVDLEGTFDVLVVWATLALPCSIMLTLILMWLFRFQVERSMKAAAGTNEFATVTESSSNKANAQIKLNLIQAGDKNTPQSGSKPIIAAGRRSALQLASIFAFATGFYALIYAIAMSVNYLQSGYTLGKSAILLGIWFLVFCTPVVLSSTMILRKQPRFLLLSVLALLTVLWLWTFVLPGDPFDAWLTFGCIPTVFSLLLNVRRLRAIGSIVFNATLIILSGFFLGFIGAIFDYARVAGPMRFAREDLAMLPPLEALRVYLTETSQLPAPEMLAAIEAFLREPRSVMYFTHSKAADTMLDIQVLAIWAIGFFLGLAIAWAFVRWLAGRYRDNGASERMLGVDVLMTIFALPFFILWVTTQKWFLAAGVMLGWLGYRLVLHWRLKNRRWAIPPVKSKSLLMLRVFGYDRRSQRLLEDIEDRWRFLGPIRLLAAADLAHTIIEPHEFFAFLNRRLGDLFVKNLTDLDRRVAGQSSAQELDGSYRVEDFYCHADTWRMAVSRLAKQADSVFMDLRGFGPDNKGCVFEIEQLIASVPLGCVTLLVDGSSDLHHLEQVLHTAIRKIPDDSPNAQPEKQQVRVLRCSSRYRQTLNSLLALLCEPDSVGCRWKKYLASPMVFLAVRA